MYQFLSFQSIRVLLVLFYVIVYFKLRTLRSMIPYDDNRLSVIFMSYIVLFVIFKEVLQLLYSFSPFLAPLLFNAQQSFIFYVISTLNDAIELVIYVTIGLLGLIFWGITRGKISREYGFTVIFILTFLITCMVSCGFDSALMFYLKTLSLLVGTTLFSAHLFRRLHWFFSEDSILKASLFGDILVFLSSFLLIIVYLIDIAWLPIDHLSSISSLLFAVLVFGVYIDVFPPSVLVSLMGGVDIE